MNPSSSSCQSRRPSISDSSVHNHNGQSTAAMSENNNTGCLLFLHKIIIKICEGWFISLGVVAILFIVIGFFKFSNDRHGESLIFTGVGFLVILSTFMASQRQRNRAQHNQPGNVIRRAEDPIYIVTLESEPSNLHRLSNPLQPPIFPSLVLPSDSAFSQLHQPYQCSPKPQNDDEPPPYEDVAAPPPSYESIVGCGESNTS